MKNQFMEFSKENLIDLTSSKGKTEKKLSSSSNESSTGSKISTSNFLDLDDLTNNFKFLNNNQIIKSKKNNARNVNGNQTFDKKNINEGNNSINNNNNLLGKKTKSIFNVKKISRKKKRLFLPHKYLFSDKNTNQDIKDICPKKELFQIYKYTYWDDCNKNNNGGRWSYEEHIRFIESFVNYGKKWKTIQKHIGTRSAEQIRSHAQKFFMRLEELITNIYCFNLNKHNIKSLFDLINLIGRNNEANKNRKEYIINTLITLTKMNQENNGKRFFEKKKENFKIETKKGIKEEIKEEIDKEKKLKDEIAKIENELLNKINNDNKEFKFDDFNSEFDINEEKDDEGILPNIKSNFENNNININKNNNLLDLKEIYVNKNTDIINYERNNNNNCKYFNNKKNQDFTGNDNNSFLLSDASDICSIDKASIEPINNLFEKNIKSTFLKFIN